MNSRLFKLTTAIPLFFFILGLTVSANLSADESDHIIKVDRKQIKQKHNKGHSKRDRHHYDNSRSRRDHGHGDRHYSRHYPRHHHRHNRDDWRYREDYRPHRYRPGYGFTYYSDDDYWDDDRLDFTIRYRLYD